jgi:flagellar protein FlgJ
LDQLRSQATRSPEKALKGAAQQFEALFLNTLLKSMRDASSGDGLFDNEQTKLYTSMLDQQFAQTLSKRGIGLADMMVKQLGQQMGASSDAGTAAETISGHDAPKPPAPVSSLLESRPLNFPTISDQPPAHRGANASAPKDEVASTPKLPTQTLQEQSGIKPTASKDAGSSARGFVERLAPQAHEVAAELGIPEKFLIGHAALESGWGRREPRFADGSSSHNLFGIKADRNWTGPVVEVTTTEYVNGRREIVKDQFRAYSSYADSLRDYADFLRSNPRYAQVFDNQRDAVGFARSLQNAGYATDPRYAEKLAGVINGPTLRASLTA